MAKKKLIFTYGIYNFFSDMTYQCTHWIPDDFTSISLEENDILYKHSFTTHWSRFSDQKSSAESIPHILKGFRDHADKLLIGDTLDEL